MSSATGDRREYPRRRLAVTGSNPVIVTAGVLPRAALVRDLSATGLGMVTTFAPPPGSVLPVWLPSRAGEPSALALFRVVHVRAVADGLHLIGTVCHDETSAAALRGFAERLGEPAPQEGVR